MKIVEFLEPSGVIADLSGRDAQGVLGELCGSLSGGAKLDRQRLLETLLEREKLGSTGVGEGVAIPHGKLAGVFGLLVAFGRSTKGVEFDAVDKRPAQLFFVLFPLENSAGIHLKVRARIGSLFKSLAF